MPLPGYLCIGILEEDNPFKSYFRFKPLLIEQNGRYVPYSEPEAYPENGCIRIVPDKNESSHFKARMRRMGLFAVVDLREHPGDNDKIRANKNYRGDDSERNVHIIYSDVVREPAPNSILSILKMSAEEAESAVFNEISTAENVVLLSEDTLLPELWNTESDEEETVRLKKTDTVIAIEDYQIFHMAGFGEATLDFAVLLPEKAACDSEVSACAEKSTVAEPTTESEPINEVSVSEQPKAVPSEDKPWISHDAPIRVPIDPERSTLSQALAAQSGLNPRRNRSLQEVIDDKWRHSRFDQLGHPVPSLTNATPAQSPAELALKALTDVWELRDQREELVNALALMSELDAAIEARRDAMRQSTVNEQLTELESQRLQMLASIEDLKRQKGNVRETLKAEIRQDEANAFTDAIEKTKKAQAELAQHEAAANRAKAAAECAEDAMNALSDGRFEKKLNEFAISSRAVDMIRRMEHAVPIDVEEVGCDATASELIERVLECFSDAGRPITQNDAINLLICAAQSPMLLLSGPTGSGKSETVRLLCRALGAKLDEYGPGKDNLELPKANPIAAVLLDDANLADNHDLTRGLTPISDRGETWICATLQDDGYPVAAHIFDRAFVVRLDAETAEAPWMPMPISAVKTYSAVAPRALRAAFAPQPDAIPEAQQQRMQKLRADLALLGIRLSRRTLTALWNYCAAAIPTMQLEPSAVLDLALAQRAIPTLLAGAPLSALVALPKLLEDLPRCSALLKQPLPVQI